MPTLRDRIKKVQREEDDKLPTSSQSNVPSLQSKSHMQKRPKPTPLRKQPSRVSKDDQLSSPSDDAHHASSSKLLIELNKGLKEEKDEPSQDRIAKKPGQRKTESSLKVAEEKEPEIMPKTRPKARPVMQEVRESSGKRVRNRPSYAEYSDDDDDDESLSSQVDNDSHEKEKRKKSALNQKHLLQEDDDAVPQSSENGQTGPKKKKKRKKEKGEIDESEIEGGIKIPQRLAVSPRDARLEELDRILSQHKSMKDDDMLDWQEDSLEFPETSEGLKICPFCHKELPEKLSKKLQKLMDHWLQKMKNSAILPSSTSTAECCQLHEGEKVLIPLGREKRWPKEYKEKRLENRIWQDEMLYERLMNLVVNPDDSEFFRRQARRREKYGRQTESVLNQMQYFHEEQAGYYGELGAVEIRNTIYAFFDEEWEPTHTLEEFTNRPGNWMKKSDFVDKVLFPEVVCELIKQDEKRRGKTIDLMEAEQIRDESNLYGSLVFPIEKMEKDTNSFFEQFSPTSPETKRRPKRGFDERCTTSSPQVGRKLSYNRSQGDSSFADEAIEVPSAQPTGSGRRTRQKSMQETPFTPVSPSRPRPRPSQSKASQQSQNQSKKTEVFGEPFSRSYSSQDRIVNCTVPPLKSSPEVQPSSSTITNVNVGFASSQSTSDRSTPNTDLDLDQEQKMRIDGIGLLPSILDD